MSLVVDTSMLPLPYPYGVLSYAKSTGNVRLTGLLAQRQVCRLEASKAANQCCAGRDDMHLLKTGLAAFAMAAVGTAAQAQGVVKIGLIAPLTGPQAAAGQQMVAGAKLYQQLNGMTAGGKTV